MSNKQTLERITQKLYILRIQEFKTQQQQLKQWEQFQVNYWNNY